MSDNYYTQEDQLTDTPEQALQNFEAQSNSLAHVVPEVAIALDQAGEAMGLLYNQMQEAGNTGAMALISASWQKVEQIANQAVQLDAARQAAIVAIDTINDERQRVTEILGELEEAIAEVNETHPAISGLVDQLREEISEDIMEVAEQNAMEYAFDVTYESAMENLKEATGCDWTQCNRFLAFLEGDYDISPETSAMLKAAIESMEMRSGGR